MFVGSVSKSSLSCVRESAPASSNCWKKKFEVIELSIYPHFTMHAWQRNNNCPDYGACDNTLPVSYRRSDRNLPSGKTWGGKTKANRWLGKCWEAESGVPWKSVIPETDTTAVDAAQPRPQSFNWLSARDLVIPRIGTLCGVCSFAFLFFFY